MIVLFGRALFAVTKQLKAIDPQWKPVING
jgi:hypothetical protein